MRGFWSLGIAAFALCAVGPRASAEAPRLAFQELTGGEGTEELRVSQISFRVCEELRKTGRFDLVCAHELLIATHRDQNPAARAFHACRETECYASEGKKLGARWTVAGRVTRDGKRYVLELEIVDVLAGKARGTSRVEGRSVARVIQAIPEAIERLPFSG